VGTRWTFLDQRDQSRVLRKRGESRLVLIERREVVIDREHSVDEHAISLDGSPEVAIVNLRRAADPRTGQSLLDRVRRR
jgi:hypothetical protein